MNTKNPSHPSNNAKKKGKNRNNNNPGPGGNNPQQNHSARGNQNQGNQNPQWDNNNKRQGRNNNNLRTNFPCALFGEYGHYTYHCPQIVDFKRMKESMNAQPPPAPSAPQQAPQHYLQQPPLDVLQNPIPHHGVMNTQQEVHPAPPQMGQYQNPGPIQPGNPIDRNILLTSKEEILLQTCGCQHDVPP
jgi:hypothetical protein